MPGKYVIRTDEEWAELIRECRSSGLSDHMWCREKGIPETSFYRHVRKFRDEHPVPCEEKEGVYGTASCEVIPKSLPSVQEIVPLMVSDEETDVSIKAVSDERTKYFSLAETTARINVGRISIELTGKADKELISSLMEAAVRLC